MDYFLLNKLPKKHQKHIVDCYAEYHEGRLRYSAVVKLDDGIVRSIGAYTLAEFKDYIKMVIEVDSNFEF